MNRSIITSVLLIISLITTINAEVIQFDGAWGEDGINIISQDANSIELVFSIEVMYSNEISVDGQDYQMFSIPGVFLPHEEGAPFLPVVSRFIAVPQGASIQTQIINTRSVTYQDIEIIPSAKIPLEDEEGSSTIQKDENIYGENEDYPGDIVQISDQFKMRGMDVVLLGISPFQFNPVTKELTVYRDLQFRINFIGGNGQFGDNRFRSRWSEPILANHLLNYHTITGYNFRTSMNTDETGAEFLIIVPDDQDIINQANRIKSYRLEQGIITDILNIETIGGPMYLWAYMLDAYETWDIFPDAILMLGDAEHISPDNYNNGIASCISDHAYLMYLDSNYESDIPFAVASRISFSDATEVGRMITRYIDYEKNPPTDADFYNTPLFTGGWQQNRWFLLCTEICRGFMKNELGKDPGSLPLPESPYNVEYEVCGPPYTYPGNYWCYPEYYCGDTPAVVAQFGPPGPTTPGGLGYIVQYPGDYMFYNGSYAYFSGSAEGINNIITDGTFMVLHRDHGSETGWGDPSYHIGEININNEANEYPFIFSVNCQTGNFQYSPMSFCEYMHRMESGGAIGITGASANSYSFVNDTYVWGIFDYMWPQFEPYPNQGSGEDHIGATTLSPGFAIYSGKYYMQASGWAYNIDKKDYTWHVHHHFGDPFSPVFTEVPQDIAITHDIYLNPGQSYVSFTAEEGAVVAVTSQNEIHGVIAATGALQTIPISYPQGPELPIFLITATKPNYRRYSAELNACTPPYSFVHYPLNEPLAIDLITEDYDQNGYQDIVIINKDESDALVIDKYINGLLDDYGTFSYDTEVYSDATLTPTVADVCHTRPSAGIEDLVVGFPDRLGFFNLSDHSRTWITGLSHSVNSLTPGFIDGDAYEDLAVGFASNYVHYYLDNNGADGLNTSATTLSIGGSVTKVVLASTDDLWDTDQAQDLLVAADNVIKLYLNTGSSPYFNGATPSQTLTIDAAEDVTDLAVADLDGDRYNDLVVCCGDIIKCFKGTDSHTFVTTPYYSHTPTVGDPIQVATGDYNYDGYPDIAVLLQESQGDEIHIRIYENTQTGFTPDAWQGGTGLNQANELLFTDIEAKGGNSVVVCGADVVGEDDQGQFVVFEYDGDPAPGTPKYFHFTLDANDHPVAHWALNGEADLDGYNIYRAALDQPGDPQPEDFVLIAQVDENTNSYTDDEVLMHVPDPTHRFYYHVTAYDLAENESDPTETLTAPGTFSPEGGDIGGVEGDGLLPKEFAMSTFPNPFNNMVSIKLALPEAADVTVELFNVMGSRVAQLYDGPAEAGYKYITFDAARLSSGIYFCRTDAGSDGDILKLILIK